MPIGENIKKIRLNKGLTQKQLGELCGMSESMIRQYELGYRNPKSETVQKIADALMVHPIAIYGREEFFEYMYKIDDTDPTEKRICVETDNYGVKIIEYRPIEKITSAFEKLNTVGQDKAIEHVELLTRIPEYLKNPEETPDDAPEE